MANFTMRSKMDKNSRLQLCFFFHFHITHLGNTLITFVKTEGSSAYAQSLITSIKVKLNNIILQFIRFYRIFTFLVSNSFRFEWYISSTTTTQWFWIVLQYLKEITLTTIGKGTLLGVAYKCAPTSLHLVQVFSTLMQTSSFSRNIIFKQKIYHRLFYQCNVSVQPQV